MTTYATLPKLIESSASDLKPTFERLTDLLGDSGESAVVQFRIVDRSSRAAWTIQIRPKSSRLLSQPAEQPDLEIVLRATTWQEIADGELSPIAAFRGGRMRVRGDYELGRRLLGRIAAPDSRLEFC